MSVERLNILQAALLVRIAEACASFEREFAQELTLEAMPLVEALWSAGGETPSVVPSNALNRGDARAFATLLGRKAADLGVSPTTFHALIPSAVTCLQKVSDVDFSACIVPLSALGFEGYVAAKVEKEKHYGDIRLGKSIVCVRPSARVALILVMGDQCAEIIEQRLSSIVLSFSDDPVSACLVHVAEMGAPEPERVRQLFQVDEGCLLLGIPCIFSGVPNTWREMLTQLNTGLRPDFADTFADGLSAMQRLAGDQPAHGVWWRRLKEFFSSDLEPSA